METKYINIDKDIDIEKIKEASEYIKQGKLVVFPTETVYGIGADATNEYAVKRIFEAKGRKSDNPLIVHISNIDMLRTIVSDIGKVEQNLIEKFWPGPLTIIFNRKDEKIISNIVTGGLDTVGVRMPNNIIALNLIKESNKPIAAPSANISGRPSGTIISDIKNELDGKVECIIDSGATEVGVESTVVRVINGIVNILRPGKITKEDIESLGLEVQFDKHIFEKVSEEKVMSPGMKYRHYAPNKRCIMIYSEDDNKMIEKINEMSIEYKNAIVLCNSKNKEKYLCNTIELGYTLDEIAQNIFRVLRQVDRMNGDIVLIEGVKKAGIGVAIFNRLIRACEYNYIEI